MSDRDTPTGPPRQPHYAEALADAYGPGTAGAGRQGTGREGEPAGPTRPQPPGESGPSETPPTPEEPRAAPATRPAPHDMPPPPAVNLSLTHQTPTLTPDAILPPGALVQSSSGDPADAGDPGAETPEPDQTATQPAQNPGPDDAADAPQPAWRTHPHDGGEHGDPYPPGAGGPHPGWGDAGQQGTGQQGTGQPGHEPYGWGPHTDGHSGGNQGGGPPWGWQQPPPGGTGGGRRRRRSLLVGLAVAAVLLVGLGSVVVANVVTTPTGGRQAAATPSGGGSPPPSDPAAPTGSSIDSQRTDPRPLVLREVFPDKKISLHGHAYRRVATSVNFDCTLTAKGALARALRQQSCERVVRATFVDGRKELAVTVGVAVLPNKNAAIRAHRSQSPRDQDAFRGMRGPKKSGAHKIHRTGGYSSGIVLGRYISYAFATYVDEDAAPRDQKLRTASQHFYQRAAKPLKKRAQ